MNRKPLAQSLAEQLTTHRNQLAGFETSRDDAERVLTMESHAHQTYAQASAVIAHCDATIPTLKSNIAHLTTSLNNLGIDPNAE